MNKIFKIAAFSGLSLIVITLACNLPSLSASQMNTETPASTASPAETATPASSPTASAQPASATPEFAPFCQPADAASVSPSSQCQVPDAQESSTFCTKKDPYNLILINKGLTYEVLTKGFKCSDAGLKDDKQLVTCTGQMAADFTINVCDPACVVPTVQAVITQCPQDYNYNDLQGCCTQEIQQLNQNCKTFNFKTTSCVINCGGINRESQCKKNSFACEWNDVDKLCEVRK